MPSLPVSDWRRPCVVYAPSRYFIRSTNAARHPIVERYLFDAVAGVNAGNGAGGVVNLTGPSALYRAAVAVLGLPMGSRFEGGTTYRAVGSNRSLRILDGNYTCPTGGVYGCAIVNSFSDNVSFKYAGYESELRQAGSTHCALVGGG